MIRIFIVDVAIPLTSLHRCNFLKMGIKMPPTISDQWRLIPYYRFFFRWILHFCNTF